MDPVHGGGPWTRGPCFVLSHYSVLSCQDCVYLGELAKVKYREHVV